MSGSSRSAVELPQRVRAGSSSASPSPLRFVLDGKRKMECESSYVQEPTCQPIMQSPICIALVGLPARGKTYIAKKLARYLNWIGLTTREFNVGEYRRDAVGAQKGSDFFHPENKEAFAARVACAKRALQDVQHFLLHEDGHAAVFDATNSTVERRQIILDHCLPHMISVFFIETICDDPDLVLENIKAVKLSSPDYKGLSMEDAIADFKKRIANYELSYQSLDPDRDRDLSWVKIYDVMHRYEANKIDGNLQARLVYYLMNIHLRPRCIYLCRHGESVCNLYGRIGGNSELSQRGWEFAYKLKEFIKKQNLTGLKVWTSQLQRTIQTASVLEGQSIQRWRALNELDVGDCEALTYDQVKQKFPREFALRDKDKYHYRYPRGESYDDLVHRLEPVIMELERQDNVLVVCHQAVMRCIIAYFLNKTKEELPYLNMPLHTIVKLTPVAYGCQVEHFPIDVPCVDTYRSKPGDTAEPKVGQNGESIARVPTDI